LDTATRHRDETDEIDLRRVVSRLWSKRGWLAGSVLLFTTAFAAAAFLTTPIYRATTVLVAAGSDRGGAGGLASLALGQLGGLASLAGINIGSGDSQTEEALAVLQSREFTEAFIRDMHLMPELFQDRWDPNLRQWKGPEARWPSMAQGAKFFDRQVRRVSKDKLTGLITMDIEWRDRAKAADWANALLERLNAEMRARAIASTNASVEYLDKELATTSAVETRQAINRLMEAQINRRMLANVTQEYALRVVDRALPPDARDPVRPQKFLLLVLGPTLGLMFGIFVVLAAGALAGGESTV
jgi:uncharacterized protein involved in exopolysaccharide biosynthesis